MGVLRQQITTTMEIAYRQSAKTNLRIKIGMSTSTFANIGKTENVSLDIILSVCNVLVCNIGDVVYVMEKGKLIFCA